MAATFRCDLGFFEGPLDLLLFLVERAEVAINDIPILSICDQYLSALESAEHVDLEYAGEFLVLAMTLMRLKSLSLLPPSPSQEAEASELRAQLVEALMEYRTVKRAAEVLRDMAEREAGRAYRRDFTGEEALAKLPILALPPKMSDLLEAMSRIAGRRRATVVRVIAADDVPVEGRIDRLLTTVARRSWTPIQATWDDDPRAVTVAVTVLACLELTRVGQLRMLQAFPYGPAWVTRRLDAPDPLPGVRPGEAAFEPSDHN